MAYINIIMLSNLAVVQSFSDIIYSLLPLFFILALLLPLCLSRWGGGGGGGGGSGLEARC